MHTPQANTVRAMMTDRVLAVTAATTLEVALKRMTESRVRHLLVMADDRHVGLVHETDLLWTLWTHDCTGRVVGTCVTAAPEVHPDDPVPVVARRMRDAGSDAALVTADGSVLGIVTATDLVYHLAAPVTD